MLPELIIKDHWKSASQCSDIQTFLEINITPITLSGSTLVELDFYPI